MAITIPVYRLALSCTYQHCPIVFVRIRQFCYLVCCKVTLCYCRTLRVRTPVCSTKTFESRSCRTCQKWFFLRKRGKTCLTAIKSNQLVEGTWGFIIISRQTPPTFSQRRLNEISCPALFGAQHTTKDIKWFCMETKASYIT